ncbi:MAG: hypothetical protein NWR72_02180, partial [Bacteroidia bacterium]|nr:hypothetical protein [Bacteroidia bacterium]
MKNTIWFSFHKSAKIALLLLAGFSLNSFSASEEENGWAEDGLKGKVKSYKEFSFKAEHLLGFIKKGKRAGATIKIYDEKGNEIEVIKY